MYLLHMHVVLYNINNNNKQKGLTQDFKKCVAGAKHPEISLRSSAKLFRFPPPFPPFPEFPYVMVY